MYISSTLQGCQYWVGGLGFLPASVSIIPATLKGNKRKIKNQKIILVGSILHLPIAHSKECEILVTAVLVYSSLILFMKLY